MHMHPFQIGSLSQLSQQLHGTNGRLLTRTSFGVCVCVWSTLYKDPLSLHILMLLLLQSNMKNLKEQNMTIETYGVGTHRDTHTHTMF